MEHAALEPLSVPLPWNLAAEGYAEELMPWFSRYALDALAGSGVAAPAAVLDVGCGPGTFSLLAAEHGLRVTAVDFAGRMLARLRRGAEERGLRPVGAVLADGAALPFREGTFESAFSLFALVFFPSPARGLAEMLRVLRPGGRAVVSAWQPLAETPLLVEAFALLEAEDGSLSFPDDALSFPGELEDALVRAGFREVSVRESTHALECGSLDDLLARLARSTPPFPQLRRRLPGADWERLWAALRARLGARFGDGAQTLRYPAWLAAGRKPA